MKICDLITCPAWLRDADTENADVEVSVSGWVTWNSGNFLGGNFRGGDFLGGDFRGGNFLCGNFLGGNFRGGNFRGGDFRGGNFLCGNFLGGDFRGGNFLGGDFRGGNFRGGDFRGGDFRGGNFRGGNFLGGNFLGGNFLCGDFRGGKVKGNKVLKLRAHRGLYPYQVTAALLEDGRRFVQMGCLWKSLEEWEKVGIRKSNPEEFPDDGSERCEERVAAFEFARAAALRMKLPTKGGAA